MSDKIVCNVRCMETALTGIQRYTQEVLSNFPESEIQLVTPGPKIARGFKGHMWEQLYLPYLTKGNLLFSPSITGPISVKNQVVVIHDVVSLEHPEWINKYFAQWYQFVLPRLVKKVKHIIAISEFAKEGIMKYLNVPDEKISVIYNGVDHDFLNSHSSKSLELPFSKYVLCLGSLEPRKNLPLLLKAWRNIISKVPEDIGLVICGKQGSKLVFANNNIDYNNLERVYFTGHVPDEYIPALYRNALFFVYPSIYEGFGLPPLEAMAVGCPVIVANQTAMPEVVKDAGYYIDPYSLADMESSLLRYIEDEELRKSNGLKGIERAKAFNWATTGTKTWQVLQSHK